MESIFVFELSRLNGKTVTKADALKYLEAAATDREGDAEFYLDLALRVMQCALRNEKNGTRLRGRPRRRRKDDLAMIAKMKEIVAKKPNLGPYALAARVTGKHPRSSDVDRLARRYKKEHPG
jgi:hypothetical protein